MLNAVAKNLRQIRIDKGLEKERLATYLNVAPRTYARYESGERLPDIDTLIKLSQLFECDLSELILDKQEDDLVSRDELFSYRDIKELGYNEHLAHGLIKQIRASSTFEEIPVVSIDKRIKFVYKKDVKNLLEKMLGDFFDE